MIKIYTIGEVAKILDISPKTLRHYDNLGLLIPHYISPETNYRYFAYDQFFRIDVIRYLNKVMNIPLKDVKKLMSDDKDYDNISALLQSHQAELTQKISELEFSKQLTETMIFDINNRGRNPNPSKIFEQYLLMRSLYYIDVNAPIEEIDIYAKRNLSRLIDTSTKENNVMCLLLNLDGFKESENLIVKGFGIFSDKKIPNLKNLNLSEGRYLTFNLLYSETNTKIGLKSLLDHAEKHDIRTHKYALLVSKMVDLTAKNKFEYYMDLQLLEK